MQLRLLHARLRSFKDEKPEIAQDLLVQCLMTAQVPIWHAGIHTATEPFGFLFEATYRVLNGKEFHEYVHLATYTDTPKSFAALKTECGPNFFGKLPAVIEFLRELQETTSMDQSPLKWLLMDLTLAYENIALLAP